VGGTINGTSIGVNATSSTYTFNVQGSSGVAPLNVSSSSGTSFLTVLGNGNVGIGTNVPTYKFVVSGLQNANDVTSVDSTTGGIMFMSINDSYGQIGTKNNYPFGFITNNTEKMRLSVNGGLSLGTSYINTDAGAGNMIIQGTLGIGTTSPTTTLFVQGSGTTNPFAVASSTGTQLLTVTTSGNVGIGTASPSQKLEVNGSIALTGSNGVLTGSGNDWTLNTSHFEAGYGLWVRGSRSTGIDATGAGGDLQLMVGGSTSEKMRITTTGNVGIGTSSPIATLFVQGTSTAGTTNPFAVASSTGTQLLTVTTSGNVGIGSTTPAATLGVAGSGYFDTSLVVGGVTNPLTIDNTGINMSRSTAYVKASSVMVYQAASYLFRNASGATDYGGINNSGNFGIGTSSPRQRLEVAGASGTPASSGTTQNGIFRISRSDTDANVLDFGLSGTSPNAAWLQATLASDLSGTYPIALNPRGGNIGIGTTTPGRTLSVVGDIRATGILYDSNNSAGTSGNFLMTTGTGYQWTSTSTLFGGNQVTGSGINGYVTRWTAANTISTGIVLDNGTVAGVNATSSSYTFNVQGGSGVNAFNIASSSGTSLVMVDQLGNVGIGTTNPDRALKIYTTGSNNASLSLFAAGSANSTILHYRGGVFKWEVGPGGRGGRALELPV
jgi:hypothetical protein